MVSTPKSNGKINRTARRQTLVAKKLKKNLSSSFLGDGMDTPTNLHAHTVTSSAGVTLPERPYVSVAVNELLTRIDHHGQSVHQELFEDEKVVFLQLSLGKLPYWTSKTLRIPLAHSVLPTEHDILLITPDMKNERNTDYEKNVEYYRTLLDKHNIQCIKEIIPYHQIRSQHQDFEMQSKLMGLYDMIISDTSISSYVNKTLGSSMTKRNKLHNHLKLHVSNLNGLFEKILKMGQVNIHGKGDTCSMQVGYLGMEETHLVDNIMAACEGLNKKLPGGFVLIKGLFLKTARSRAIQFYVSQSNFSLLKVPKNSPKLNAPVKGELSTEMDAEVTVTPGGDVFLSKSPKVRSGAKRIRKQPERLQMPVAILAPKVTRKKLKIDDKENNAKPMKKRGKKQTNPKESLTDISSENKLNKSGKNPKLSNGTTAPAPEDIELFPKKSKVPKKAKGQPKIAKQEEANVLSPSPKRKLAGSITGSEPVEKKKGKRVGKKAAA